MNRLSDSLYKTSFFIKAGLLFFITLFFSCAPQLERPALKISPIVRVGIVQHADEISFKASEPFFISTRSKTFPVSKSVDQQWHVTVDNIKTGETEYRFYLSTHSSRQTAEQKAATLRRKGLRVEVERKGQVLSDGDNLIAGSARYILYAQKKFSSRAQAVAYQAKNILLKNAEIVTIDGRASGEMQIVPQDGRAVVVKDVVRLSGAHFTIMNVQVGSGYHWSRKENRTYAGDIELQIDDQGTITIINVLPLEEYLKGVLPGEMSAKFPLEALKAQAIAARTFFLHGFGKKHLNDPFDVCANVHCQVFVGTVHVNKKVERAVDETRGIVLQYNGKLCETPYSAICGGHTEFAQNVWASEGQPYLRGVFDISESVASAEFDLTDEDNVRKWIESSPQVFCNVELNRTPDYAQYAKKYFRWQVEFSRQQLQQSITKWHKKSFGDLIDIIPLERGPSGRLKSIKVRGTEEAFVIRKELNIRKALSAKTLYSACFVLDRLDFINGLPDRFVIKGAGWGHGVGMCQIGAAMMAEQGENAATILKHYYSDISFEKIYK